MQITGICSTFIYRSSKIQKCLKKELSACSCSSMARILCIYVICSDKGHNSFIMNFQSTLDSVAVNGYLAQKGWLAKDLLQAYSKGFSSNLLEQMKKILSISLSSHKNKEMKVVSLQLESLLPDSRGEDIEYLCSKRRTFFTKGLWRLLVPFGSHRFQIQSIREKTVANLRNQKEPALQEKKILSELYFLLSLGSTELWDLFQHPLPILNQSQVKKCLTSLKKMMGNQVEMEQEDKKLKKKAYNQNLEIRRVLEAISTLIVEEDLSIKVKKMLQAPKNKKWFGTRLNKLMVSDDWSLADMKIFADYLEHSWTLKEIDGVKIAKAKITLKQVHSNIMKSFHPQNQQSVSCLPDDTETKREEKTQPLKKNSEDFIDISPLNFSTSNKRYSLFECLLLDESNDLN